ncbi:ImmA/IrrE family metallo-endopeptidase [Sporosarcina sp. E16_8]|uniref:ImmA/IrrE family metallo-endopeptidase n=1 Tax=Sporosarcina sp. E16_8 TaxID=2789295 RepID=UPI0021069806|nr:ImmA/IrrE family metallo-endopeptidase [Sporosarcina sp. E16_8]
MKTSYLSPLEEKVFSIYDSLKISEPAQIYHANLIEDLSTMLKIKIYYFDEPSEANNLGGVYRIFLNENQSKQAIWQDFAHELAHILRHEGYQWSMNKPFREYQEWQAEQFAFHFCIPTFMLNHLELPRLKCEAVGFIATLFNVEPTFADARLEKWLLNQEVFYLNRL